MRFASPAASREDVRSKRKTQKRKFVSSSDGGWNAPAPVIPCRAEFEMGVS